MQSVVTKMGGLAFASRLKAISDQLYAAGDRAYQKAGFEFQSRWFPVIVTLQSSKAPLSVGDLAQAIGQTHASVSQIVKQLQKEGLVETTRDPKDDRKRMLTLTQTGRELVAEITPFWGSIRAAFRELFTEVGGDILSKIENLESSLKEKQLDDRILGKHEKEQRGEVTLTEYAPEYASYFRTLNEEWLKKYFYIEECDAKVLSNPEKIIADGGMIFFARYDNKVVGTCALMLAEDGRFELTKMAVTDAYQGLKIGKKLFQKAVDWYEKNGNNAGLFLYTSTRLIPAIKLYEKNGFVSKPVPEGCKYERGDYYMEYEP